MKVDQLNQFIIRFDEVSLFRQRNKRLRKPNFIGVGAGRCGTTSIYQYLSQHPDVYMSPVKEINYFGIRNTEKNQYGLSFREYLNYFLGAENQTCVGEISPAYLTTPGTASLIKEKLGDVKILITIRDPIDRSISQYKHHLNKHKIDDINEYFEKGLKALFSDNVKKFQSDWFHPAKNIMQSMYTEGIKTYLDCFHEENVMILTYDDVKDNTSSLLNTVCDYLGIDYTQKDLKRTNSSFSDQSISLRPELLSELINLFGQDLESLDEITGLQTTKWMGNYE